MCSGSTQRSSSTHVSPAGTSDDQATTRPSSSEPVGLDVPERLADPRGDLVGRLDALVAEVEDADDDRLVTDAGERPELEAWLRGLEHELVDGEVGELVEERVARPRRLVARRE